MRIIFCFNGGGLTINFEDIEKIYDYEDHIVLLGAHDITVVVNAFDICRVPSLTILKSWILSADEVYFDTRIEKRD